MNQGYMWINLLTAALFAVFAFIFAYGKDRAVCRLIAGFNDFSPQKQAEYDTRAMALDYRNLMLKLTAVFLIAAVLVRITDHPLLITLAAYVILLILVFRDFHLDPYKAFEPYRKENSVRQ